MNTPTTSQTSTLADGELIRRMREALEASTELFCDREDKRELLIMAALGLQRSEAEAHATENAEKAKLLDKLVASPPPPGGKETAKFFLDWFLEANGWYRYTDPADMQVRLAKLK